MIYTPLTKKALCIAFNAHKEQTDKDELPYMSYRAKAHVHWKTGNKKTEIFYALGNFCSASILLAVL